eukprot:scaffold676_cov273-Pinguiococcus_pyrenoidosus.AAC.13
MDIFGSNHRDVELSSAMRQCVQRKPFGNPEIQARALSWTLSIPLQRFLDSNGYAHRAHVWEPRHRIAPGPRRDTDEQNLQDQLTEEGRLPSARAFPAIFRSPQFQIWPRAPHRASRKARKRSRTRTTTSTVFTGASLTKTARVAWRNSVDSCGAQQAMGQHRRAGASGQARSHGARTV